VLCRFRIADHCWPSLVTLTPLPEERPFLEAAIEPVAKHTRAKRSCPGTATTDGASASTSGASATPYTRQANRMIATIIIGSPKLTARVTRKATRKFRQPAKSRADDRHGKKVAAKYRMTPTPVPWGRIVEK